LRASRHHLLSYSQNGDNRKYSQTAFPGSDSRSKGILDLIHSNVCGPMSIVSFSGYHYYVSFIDDFSKKTWIYFMNTKDEVFNRFQDFKALVENQTGRKIKVLRSDNGASIPPMISRASAHMQESRGS
jgi:hypothetical protein